ncbi:ABC transporter substrate-binding protein [Bryobacterales bacterium F-183]|nr:ABC transporter substrate-binding protein [Bryobacterales bacterium F-183]
MRALLSVIQLALATLWENKLRSFLTVLGVIIGTGTIIGVGSILTGFDGAVTGVLRSFGTDTLIVFKFQVGPRFGDLTAEERQRKPLSYENAMALKDRATTLERISPYLMAPWNGQINKVRYKGNDMLQVQMGGTDESYALGGQAEMQTGRFFTDAESYHRSPVVVIGEDVYKALFSTEEAIGKNIDVNGHQFTVVGVMKRPSNSFPGSQDKRVLLPYFTMKKLFPSAKENMLILVAKQGQFLAAQDEVRAILRQERRVPLSKPDNFSISTSEQMVEDFRKITSLTAIVMVVLSSIGLLVGGIGVMNIMLVSVTERTREIGTRKAIGARRRDIVMQFLTEAVVLTGLGGIAGMTVGWTISMIVRILMPDLPTVVPAWAAILGVAVSVGVGLFFGIWPANKAARLDPVDALRYE